MRINLHSNTYSGVAGSSMSDTRCEQTLALYRFVKSHPALSYTEVRRQTVQEHLYRSESVLRTFCPLLRELGYVTYGTNESFQFTTDGEVLIRILMAQEKVEQLEDSSVKTALESRLQDARARMIELGILNMNRSEEDICREHNIWMVLYILKNLGSIDWSEFFLALKVFKEDHLTLADFSSQIAQNRPNGVEYQTYNEDGQTVADTQWSYIRSLLREANLISDNGRTSTLTTEGQQFVNKVTLWNL